MLADNIKLALNSLKRENQSKYIIVASCRTCRMESARGTRTHVFTMEMNQSMVMIFMFQLLFNYSRRNIAEMNDSVISSLNAELESIVQKNDVEVEKYLRNYVRRVNYRRFAKYFFVVLVLFGGIYWVPLLNWNASAIGRLALIKVVRPFYNWEVWTDARCLIDLSETSAERESEEHNTIDSNYIGSEECFTCENLSKSYIWSLIFLHFQPSIVRFLLIHFTESIDRQSNISFRQLQSNYLWRNRPVIIIDSHPTWVDIHHGVNLIEFTKTMPDLMMSEPCNIATNLLAKSATVRKIIRQVEQMETHEKWFFHFRNCHFESVKASRAVIPYHQRPHYLPNHLPPFRSSWILVSHQYEKMASKFDTNFEPEFRTMKHLNVRDSVVVMQLQGEIYGRLDVNTVCTDQCADHTFRLAVGQSIVFGARFWNFYYQPIGVADDDELDTVITFIAEFEWN